MKDTFNSDFYVTSEPLSLYCSWHLLSKGSHSLT
jgi:hypothetical protein